MHSKLYSQLPPPAAINNCCYSPPGGRDVSVPRMVAAEPGIALHARMKRLRLKVFESRVHGSVIGDQCEHFQCRV